MTDPKVTMADLREAGHCASGIRKFFVDHDLDLRRLVREGIPASELEHISDANMQRVIAKVRSDHGQE